MSDAMAPTTAWADRWNPPTFDALMAELNEPASIHMPKLFTNIRGEVADLEQRVIWHGTSWRWTVEFSAPSQISTAGGEGREVLFYFVPNPEEPLVCVPLRPEVLEHLPIRRLNRYIRDGIRGAKWAVDIRWGKWIITANTEVEHMTDLLKRKAKIFIEESVSQKRSKKAG
jgi:hypothetical protein